MKQENEMFVFVVLQLISIELLLIPCILCSQLAKIIKTVSRNVIKLCLLTIIKYAWYDEEIIERIQQSELWSCFIFETEIIAHKMNCVNFLSSRPVGSLIVF